MDGQWRLKGQLTWPHSGCPYGSCSFFLRIYPILINISIIMYHQPNTIWVWVMVFNTTFKNISAILFRSILLMGETRVLWENHWPAASQTNFITSNTLIWKTYQSLTKEQNSWENSLLGGNNGGSSCKTLVNTSKSVRQFLYGNSPVANSTWKDKKFTVYSTMLHISEWLISV